MTNTSLKSILEAALMAAGRPLSIDQMLMLFLDSEQPERDEIRIALEELQNDYADRPVELKQVASGYRIQVREQYSEWVSRLWSERPSRYSRALLETLALVAYRQPITRGEIEDIRGVSVSSSIMKTLQERDWVKVVGHRDVPGKPAMYATTRQFLDYFNLKSLDEMPTLAELRDLDHINAELDLEIPGVVTGDETVSGEETSDAADEPQEAVEQDAQHDATEVTDDVQEEVHDVRSSA
jgi:segregation and condensation protein B